MENIDFIALNPTFSFLANKSSGRFDYGLYITNLRCYMIS